MYTCHRDVIEFRTLLIGSSFLRLTFYTFKDLIKKNPCEVGTVYFQIIVPNIWFTKQENIKPEKYDNILQSMPPIICGRC